MRNADLVMELGWAGESQQRRANNRDSSAKLLEERGISFVSRNSGAHLIVEHGGVTVDFWPGTGKFTQRGVTKSGRGVFNLLKLLGVEP